MFSGLVYLGVEDVVVVMVVDFDAVEWVLELYGFVLVGLGIDAVWLLVWFL